MRIAYVEDNPTNLALVERVAGMNKHTVVSYPEGEIAMRELLRETFDLILMDVELAGQVTGLEVTRQLRANGLKTPIIAVTAYAMQGDMDRCIEAGCNEYLPKPLPIVGLISVLAKYQEMTQSRSDVPATAKTKTGELAMKPVTAPAPVSEAPVTTIPADKMKTGQLTVKPESPVVPASEAPVTTTPAVETKTGQLVMKPETPAAPASETPITTTPTAKMKTGQLAVEPPASPITTAPKTDAVQPAANQAPAPSETTASAASSPVTPEPKSDAVAGTEITPLLTPIPGTPEPTVMSVTPISVPVPADVKTDIKTDEDTGAKPELLLNSINTPTDVPSTPITAAESQPSGKNTDEDIKADPEKSKPLSQMP